MSKEIGYNDWDKVCKACEKEFDLIDTTRVSMDVAEQCQRITYKLALKKRAEFPEPKPVKTSEIKDIKEIQKAPGVF
jgi:hypothetical protein